MINPNLHGQPFLKYLVNLPVYTQDDYTHKKLANELVQVAQQLGLTEKTHIETETLYYWLRGNKFPLWAQRSAFELALLNDWRVLDKQDFFELIRLSNKCFHVENQTSLLAFMAIRQMVIPKPLLEEVNELFDILDIKK